MSETEKYISYSRVQAWRSCHQRHYWRYVEGIEKVVPNLALERGKVLHAMLEAHLKGKSWEKVLDTYKVEYDKLFDEEKEELGDLPADLEKLMRGYIRTWQNDPLKYPIIEHHFDVPLFSEDDMVKFIEAYEEAGYNFPVSIHFVGKIDAIADDGKKKWIVEHKTMSRIPDEGARFFDLQTALYLYATRQDLELQFIEPSGILWNYIRTKVPVEPEILKSGKLSERKNMDTDYHTYYNAVVRAGQNPSDYAAMLNMLREKPNTFYKRHYMPIAGDNLLNAMLNDFRASSLDIIINGNNDRVKTLSLACNNCEYKDLCQAELTGSDVDFVKARSYQKIEKEQLEG